MASARLDVRSMWSKLNDGLIELVEYIPANKLDWSPKPQLWNFRGILLHIAYSRGIWFATATQDVSEPPAMLSTARSAREIQDAYRETWERIDAFLTEPDRVDAEYPDEGTGHRILFHLLEHDIHHRADLFHYLALLDIEHPNVGTP